MKCHTPLKVQYSILVQCNSSTGEQLGFTSAQVISKKAKIKASPCKKRAIVRMQELAPASPHTA